MKHGMTPKDAILDALKRVSRNFNDDKKRLAAVELDFYALRKDGEYAAGSLWSGSQFAICTGDAAAHTEASIYLYERPRG